MEIVTKVMEKSWKFVGKNVYEPWLYYHNALPKDSAYLNLSSVANSVK